MNFNANMIYSKRLGREIPVTVTSKSKFLPGYGRYTKYTVKDGEIPIGYVDLRDTDLGVYVDFIKKTNPEYKHFGEFADMLEVNHCLKKGLNEDFMEITSQAGLNSHVQHYKRGKRYFDEGINNHIKNLIKNAKKGTILDTKSIGPVDMYMPKELINKCIEKLKKHPIL